MVRVILHLDLDAFFCAVEEQRDSSLKGIPFAVGGKPDQRGVVASCSYAARQYGVRSAMPMVQAVRLCPELVIVSHHFSDYRAMSHRVIDILKNLTPLVEQISIDEAFLDVTGIRGTGLEIAKNLQANINTDLNLPCSLGVASNKLIAKIANNLGKRNASQDSAQAPNVIKVVPAGQEASFLAPLSIQELWGVGPKTAEKLQQMQIYTIGDLARCSIDQMRRLFGKIGADIVQRARGIDNRPVSPESEAKSISKEITFSVDVRDEAKIINTLRQLSDGVGRQTRKLGLRGKTITLKLRWADFTTLHRQITLNQPTNLDREIHETALKILEQEWHEKHPIRLIGIGISGFDTSARQLSLWETEVNKQELKLQATLDDLRDRFGETTIKRGSDLK